MSERAVASRPALHLGARGLLAAWHGPLGPAVCRFDTWQRARPRFVRGIGHAGADRPVVPALRRDGDEIEVAWCEEDGAWSVRLDLDGAPRSEARLRHPAASAVAFGGAVLFAADPEGVVAIRPGDAAPLRLVSERRPGFAIDAAALAAEALVVFHVAGERSWGAASVPPRGAPTVVRHDLRAACESLRVRSVGSRAAVALGLAGGACRLAIVGAAAKVIERPHEVFDRSHGALRWPEVVWTDNRWTALAYRPADEGLVVEAVAGAFALPRCAGPFAAGFFNQRFYALEIEPRGEAVELRLWRVGADGKEPQQRVVELPLDDQAERRVARSVRATLQSVAHEIEARADYRGGSVRPELSRDGAALSMRDDDGIVTLRARPVLDGGVDGAPDAAVAVRVESAMGEGLAVTPAPSSLVRLARWIRARWSSEERARAEAREAEARTLAEALDARVEGVELAGNTLVLHLLLQVMPSPDQLVRWLRRLRDAQARLTADPARLS